MELNRCLQILEISPGATYEVAKESYRLLVKVWHPDKHNHDEKVLAKATDKLKEINAAWGELQAHYNSGTGHAVKSASLDELERRRAFRRAIFRQIHANFGYFY